MTQAIANSRVTAYKRGKGDYFMASSQRLLRGIHREGYRFILVGILVTLAFGYFDHTLGWISAILTGWCVYFFRDPARVTPLQDGLVVSPADGVVCQIITTNPPAELNMPEGDYTCVSIFLNVFNVHVNRVPVDGTIKRLDYRPGKFFNASLDKASVDNERQSMWVETEAGHHLAFVQIAGLIARRIVCELEEGDVVRAGERFGIIRFGSRMDVYLPAKIAPQVVVGQTMIGGETILANLSAKQQLVRLGETRD
jgi:phosphatidylserine decarboxylase